MIKEFEEICAELKQKAFINMMFYFFSRDKKYNAALHIDFILWSFFENSKNIDGFLHKYSAFKAEDELIQKSNLFGLTEKIYNSDEKYTNDIKRAILIYNSIIKDEEYNRLINDSSYKLSPDFGLEDSYYSNLLYDKIQFYYAVRDKYDEAYQRIMKKWDNYRGR